ncbi:MAG: hypothetical protein ACYDHO_03680 [Gaiellaceae bacterium]
MKWHRKSEEGSPPEPEPGLDLDADVEQTVERPAEPVAATEMPFAGASVASGGGSFVGIPRMRGNWDLVVTGDAPGLTGSDELGFVVVEDGDIFMDSQLPEGDVTPLAEAIELRIQPPYRAYGTRQDGDQWAVAARPIKLGRFQADGDELELTIRGGERELAVDGSRSSADVPELERLGEGEGADFFARAVRIEDDLWELTVNPL